MASRAAVKRRGSLRWPAALHNQLVDLARNVWKLSALVVAATGVGAGLASFLADRLGHGPRRTIVAPFLL